MNIVFCGGGTSGHIMPAIAIAEHFEEIDKSAKITFIVRKGGKENEILRKRNKSMREIEITGLKRKITLKNLKCIKNAVSATKECQKIFEKLKPDCIIGTGGYVCFPAIIAGKRLKIPTFIHESNIYPGLVTRLISSKCDKVFLSNEESKKFLSKRGIYSVVGTPLIKEYAEITRNSARKKLQLTDQDKLIVSFGGSIGAEKINKVMIDVMKEYTSREKNIIHIHATGARLYENCIRDYHPEKKHKCTLVPYIENMPTMLWAADLVICRAGAMTIAEITATNAPSIIIPSPHVAGNHQYKNAKILEEKGSVIMIEEKDLQKDILIKNMCQVLNGDVHFERSARKTKRGGGTNSQEIMCNEILNIVKPSF